MEIQIEFEDANETEFMIGFLSCCPVPLIENPPTVYTASMSEADWVTEWVKKQLTNAYETGKHKLAQLDTVIVNDFYKP